MGRSELKRVCSRWTARVGAAVLLMSGACSSEPDDAGGGGGGGGACTPSAATACTCSDGSAATATCDSTGSVLGPCTCPAGTTPMGGALPSTMTPAAPPTMTAPTAPTTPTTPTTDPVGMAGSAAMDPIMDPADPMMDPASDPMTPAGDEVPAGEHCAAVATWDPAWTAFEDEVLRLTNEWRAKGADCGAQGTFGPAAPLTMNALLRCSSRLHSKDMGENDFFDHTNLAGEDPFDRMAAAGYQGFTMGENIAMGQQSPEEVVNGWIDSDGHCRNIMDDGFTEIGVGYWEGAADNQWFNGNKLWTQNFGAPGGGGLPWGG